METATDIDLETFLSQIADRPLRSIEPLFPEPATPSLAMKRADRLLVEGWRLGRFPAIPMASPIAWRTACEENRSWHYKLHCWEPVLSLLESVALSDSELHLREAVRIAIDWIGQHETFDTGEPFAWYDMAIGIRSYRLGYLLDVAARSEAVSRSSIRSLLHSARLHASVLAREELFAAHSNHGLYYAVGQLLLTSRFPMLPGFVDGCQQALHRIESLLNSQFDASGVHREHSPDYHYMVGTTVKAISETGLLSTPGLKELCENILTSLEWFVMPDTLLAPFGDTSTKRVEFKAGSMPDARVFETAGYAILARTECTYLAQTCCFHSRVHKHADDLTFIWYDRGQHILVDAGRYGYYGKTAPQSEEAKEGFWYSDPKRKFVESTRAHNTISIDGKDLPRVGVKPYGSAIKRWSVEGDVRFVETEVIHFKSIKRARVLIHKPAEWLVVYDWLIDTKETPHEYVQRFNFDPAIELSTSGAQLCAELANGADRLYVTPLIECELLQPMKGQTEPELLGWISRVEGELVPNWSAAYRLAGASKGAFGTLFSFGRTPTTGCESVIQPSGRHCRFSWIQDGVSHSLVLQRPVLGPAKVLYSSRREVSSREDLTPKSA